MPTLRAVLQMANGLYRDLRDGTGYVREDLLAQLPEETLARQVDVSKVRPGVYIIQLQGPDEDAAYELFSRRRAPRDG
jgi:hypothetical protein